jgi:hypothetical protein
MVDGSQHGLQQVLLEQSSRNDFKTDPQLLHQLVYQVVDSLSQISLLHVEELLDHVVSDEQGEGKEGLRQFSGGLNGFDDLAHGDDDELDEFPEAVPAELVEQADIDVLAVDDLGEGCVNFHQAVLL